MTKVKFDPLPRRSMFHDTGEPKDAEERIRQRADELKASGTLRFKELPTEPTAEIVAANTAPKDATVERLRRLINPPRLVDLTDKISPESQHEEVAVSMPKRRGRRAIGSGGKSTMIGLRLSPELLARLDAFRGSDTRVDAIRQILEERL